MSKDATDSRPVQQLGKGRVVEILEVDGLTITKQFGYGPTVITPVDCAS